MQQDSQSIANIRQIFKLWFNFHLVSMIELLKLEFQLELSLTKVKKLITEYDVID